MWTAASRSLQASYIPLSDPSRPQQEALAHLALSSNPDWLAWARNEDSLATLDHETVSGKFQALAWLLRQWCTRGESCVILSHNARLQGLLQVRLRMARAPSQWIAWPCSFTMDRLAVFHPTPPSYRIGFSRRK